MATRRSKLEIMLSVLSVVRDGVDKPTRIMYATNLSWNPAQEVLSRLVEEGLLGVYDEPSQKRSRKRYHVTERGLHVLNYLKGAEALISL